MTSSRSGESGANGRRPSGEGLTVATPFHRALCRATRVVDRVSWAAARRSRADHPDQCVDTDGGYAKKARIGLAEFEDDEHRARHRDRSQHNRKDADHIERVQDAIA